MKNTIKDVARKAGVSISTVSRVFNNTAIVDVPTKERVLQAAKELRYSPNQAARSLTRSETNTIGLILPGIYGEYFSEVLRGMDGVAAEADFDIMISGSRSIGTKFEKSVRAMSGRVDGLIVMSPSIDSAQLREIIPSSLPSVLLNADEDLPDFDTINFDNQQAAVTAVEHLVRLGHSRIALIKGVDSSYDARQRTEGYRKAVRANGLDQYCVEVQGAFTKDSGYAAMKELLQQKVRPTAVFASNDAMALGAIHAIQEEGLSVPKGIAVVGFDDIPMSRYSNPPLSTIRIDLAQFGAMAMRRILQAVKNKKRHVVEHATTGYELIVRASCGSG